MTLEEKQQSFVMLKEAVTTLKQRIDELWEATYTAWITDIPGIMEELIKVDRTHNASFKALSAIITLIDVKHLHSPEMEAYDDLTGCDKHSDIYSQHFGRGEGDDAGCCTEIVDEVAVGGCNDVDGDNVHAKNKKDGQVAGADEKDSKYGNDANIIEVNHGVTLFSNNDVT